MRRTIAKSRAIVTGASSGIGRELALELARRGAGLVVNARREDRLQSLADEIATLGCQAAVIPGDITEPGTRSRLVAAAHEQLGGLDVLVNNAGVGALGPFADAASERLRRIMEVNFFAPVELLRAALPLLQLGRRPIIVNIASVLGHRAVPNKSEYCASKFALHGFSDALRAELTSAGIDVLVVCPSTTESEFFENVLEQRVSPRITTRPMSARTVARRTVDAIERGRHEVILSATGKAFVWLDRLLPGLADRLVARFG
jgi:short-subunit dehydrogenase